MHRVASRRNFCRGREAKTPLYRAYCKFWRQSPRRKGQARRREALHPGLLVSPMSSMPTKDDWDAVVSALEVGLAAFGIPAPLTAARKVVGMIQRHATQNGRTENEHSEIARLDLMEEAIEPLAGAALEELDRLRELEDGQEKIRLGQDQMVELLRRALPDLGKRARVETVASLAPPGAAEDDLPEFALWFLVQLYRTWVTDPAINTSIGHGSLRAFMELEDRGLARHGGRRQSAFVTREGRRVVEAMRDHMEPRVVRVEWVPGVPGGANVREAIGGARSPTRCRSRPAWSATHWASCPCCRWPSARSDRHARPARSSPGSRPTPCWPSAPARWCCP
ncbi:hypothetical protein ENSA5_58550 [Enhygromyxa salina]|uniref:Uncharacterized protein n=1 Tax=Enhygromyxa salina TaxID=215803 RepID=A0A2S9XE23_9BACT|nr:hypothetical protein ENSA5_58550 [Enhygromyxa salina]